jgi:hypothetical protein
MEQRPPVDQDLIIEASRSHSDTRLSVWLLWLRGQPDAETSIWQHTTNTKYSTTYSQRGSNPQTEQVSGSRPTPYTARPLAAGA